ncbi:Biotin carboxyl carrier protein of acetyl-CoA carboxylase [Liberibacter crescens BT-1]|uniref:Biotin carboxyl carrier protein of acetyl-CoA carboxylase n=1 Tax=Liberibacter crescens (strain BT-1) TaxID=1215343 RepID=L0EVC1_LIBCB|nr:acetyl-CoA carboxylase biotin carboxyl carrier protein [Liberibacter crescens]AGA64902.1 Biotin carboxyl carrier protein of acetyl-CoA carboxylase [Liberibacter crescens BT-1]AMC12931.1 hypothetical protein RL73_04585 [Liberibacter crescens]
MTIKQQSIDLVLIRNLANILNETNLTEIKIDHNGISIYLSRSSAKTLTTTHYPDPESSPPFSPTVMQTIEPARFPVSPSSSHQDTQFSVASSAVPAIKSTINDNTHIVTSPMVGTAYLSPGPGEKPFVEAGNLVTEGQTLLIIEAMKTMNHITAPRSGKIIEIKVTDTQLVEYGEPLLMIE